MRFLRFLLFSALVFAAAGAHAQWSAYATADLTVYGIQNSNNTGLTFKAASGGGMLGALYNFPVQSRATLGIDTHGEYSPGDKGGAFVTTAIRVGFVPRRNPLRPFFALGGGVVTTQVKPIGNGDTFSTVRRTGGVLALDFGLDIRLSDHFDYRLLDYGGAGGGKVGAGFLGTGVVYHFSNSGH